VRPEGLGKFKNPPHRDLNPRPSGLQHSALTTTLSVTEYFMLNLNTSVAQSTSGEGKKTHLMTDRPLRLPETEYPVTATASWRYPSYAVSYTSLQRSSFFPFRKAYKRTAACCLTSPVVKVSLYSIFLGSL
jgi:hypothetical protein